MKSSRRAAKASAAVTLALALAAAHPGVAQARASDAVQGCGAHDVHDGKATVPSNTQSSILFTVKTSKGSFPIRCGNGTTAGAVHIEVKHDVPDWADALSCITKAINRTKGTSGGSGKTKYSYGFAGGTVIVVRGTIGIITAYPKGGSVAQKWRDCSAS